MYNMSQTKKECPIHLLGTVTIGPKGQVVIPVEAREKMGLNPGDKLVALYVTEKKSVAFVPESQLESIIEKMATHIGVLKDVLNK
ncbi:AbrB/MazE/SpoVT family DNA-binding domain-containing protein [Pedobacter sp.]|nr:AbrB/MazE/SpoVT family DNA-binding domain-containing protein [Candidatus Saccharibacteria bacterium]